MAWSRMTLSYSIAHGTLIILWWRGVVSRGSATKIYLGGTMLFYGLRAWLSQDPHLILWTISPGPFFISFAVVTSGPRWGLLILIFFTSGVYVCEHWLPKIDPWLPVEAAKGYLSKPLPMLVMLFVYALQVHQSHDLDIRVSKLIELSEDKDLFIALVCITTDSTPIHSQFLLTLFRYPMKFEPL